MPACSTRHRLALAKVSSGAQARSCSSSSPGGDCHLSARALQLILQQVSLPQERPQPVLQDSMTTNSLWQMLGLKSMSAKFLRWAGKPLSPVEAPSRFP